MFDWTASEFRSNLVWGSNQGHGDRHKPKSGHLIVASLLGAQSIAGTDSSLNDVQLLPTDAYFARNCASAHRRQLSNNHFDKWIRIMQTCLLLMYRGVAIQTGCIPKSGPELESSCFCADMCVRIRIAKLYQLRNTHSWAPPTTLLAIPLYPKYLSCDFINS